VEDHPLDYRNFEGTIPEGSYGAGTVMVWDQGTYHITTSTDKTVSQQVLHEELKRGDVKITLHGQKLKGDFALFRFKTAGEHAWLIMKHADKFAGTEIENADRSVLSGRTMEEIKLAGAGITIDSRLQSAMPLEVKPMLAVLTTEAFSDPDWLFELKLDGYRALAQVKDKSLRLYSRNNITLNKDFAPIVAELEKLPDVVLDGELVVIDADGRSQFQLLQNYRSTGTGNLQYVVFDLLYLNGFDLRVLPLVERKQLLQKLIGDNKLIKYSDHVLEDGKNFLQAAAEKSVEGIIAKRKASKYQSGLRSGDWRKIKLIQSQEVVIGGYTYPQGQREEFGSLLVGVYAGRKFNYVGLVGGGFSDAELADIKAKLDKSKTDKSPFSNLSYLPNVAQWVKPKLVCEVKFSEWTAGGLMRHPVFVGMREDKFSTEVTQELPESAKQMQSIPIAKIITHPEKIYWPDEKYTKADLLAYYQDVSPILLPYLYGRPQNLNRFPHGIDGEGFYQKDVDDYLPDFVKTVKIHSESADREVNYLVCQNLPTLIYMANLGCIEINPWTSRVGSIDIPDYLILDLDPEAVSFAKLVKVAIKINELLEKLDISAVCKTSGKRGLHIYIPLSTDYTFDQVRQFTEILGLAIRSTLPELISLERSPGERQGKVYVDYLQNRKGQTTATAYSVRPVKGATISTPLKWSELTSKLDPHKFTITTIRKRIDKMGDIWLNSIESKFDMLTALEKLQKVLNKS
jgi:bifunctional non-homologous end joining protein LigD